MLSGQTIQARCRNRWPSILEMLGVPKKLLNGKHHACPWCGGNDRFRFDDKEGTGSFICSHCGAGHGVAFTMKFLGTDFEGAKLAIEAKIGHLRIERPSARAGADTMEDYVAGLWGRASALGEFDPCSLYLERRGLECRPWPSQLRYAASLPYKDDATKTIVGYHGAMVAKFVSADALRFTLHRTFLAPDGRKAPVDKPKKMCAGKIPKGGSVRLAPSAEIMGIAEGIETALAAAALFGMPVWSATSANLMQAWQPPPKAREVWIFGDNDASWTGHVVSYALAYRLTQAGLKTEVRIAPNMGEDWNDVLMQQRGIVPDFGARNFQPQESGHGNETGEFEQYQGHWL